MQMTEVLDKLKKLQDILAEKYELEDKITSLPKTLDGSNESLERFKKEYIEKNAVYEAEKAKVAALKSELSDAESSRESGEKGMDAITTHREYEALDKQISEANEKEQNIRKELQKEEKTLAELNETLKSNEELISSTEKEVNSAKDNLNKELEGYKKSLDKLKTKEDAITPGIDPEVIFKFQRIIQRNRKGIVAVKGNVCDGCHMILPAQFANEVHQGEKILFCPYCSRILYYEEDVDNTSTFFQMDDTSSLVDLDDEGSDEYADDENDEDQNEDREEGDEDDEDNGEMKSMDYEDR